MAQPQLDRLLAQLNVSGIQNTNNPLYQVIVQLINQIRQIIDDLNGQIDDTGTVIGNLSDLDFLTWTNEAVDLPNSRQLIAGTNVVFDDTIVNERTINAAGASTPSDPYYEPLTNGDPINPELIFNSDGDVVSVWVTP